MSIDIIPEIILAKIFEELPLRDLADNLIVVCKKFTKVCKGHKRLQKKVWMWKLWGEREVPPQTKSKTIYIGNVAKDVKEEEIYKLVPNPEEVASVRIVSEKHKFHSPSYAYINFNSIEEAEKMLPLTFTELHGKRIVCNFKQIETSKHNICNVGNIYIDKIGDRTAKNEEEMLAQLLRYGEIISLRIESKRAFIQYAKKEAAIECVVNMDGQMMGQTAIEVRPFVSKERRKVGKKIYIKNLAPKTTREKLINFFSANFGAKPMECKVFPETNKMGEKMAWIEFPDEIADKILSENSEVNFEGATITLSDNKDHRKSPINFRENFYSGYQCNVYINNLHEKVNERELENCFSRFGEIVSLKIARDENKRSKGFAYICFRQPQQALLAIEKMNNQILHPGKKKLHVTIWQPKEARLSNMYAFPVASHPFFNFDPNYVPNDPNFFVDPQQQFPYTVENPNVVRPEGMQQMQQMPMYEYMMFPPHAYFAPPQQIHQPIPQMPPQQVPQPSQRMNYNYNFYNPNDRQSNSYDSLKQEHN